jgi:3',5'-cyclic AMP phosphodiesterase CpdA
LLYIKYNEEHLKIAHISDLHLCTNNQSGNYKNTERLIRNIANEKYDHLVITGDIAHLAGRKDLTKAAEILDDYGFNSGNKLSVVIGNHDIFGGVHYAEDIITFPGRCGAVDYKAKVNEFCEIFASAFEGCYRPDTKEYFPYLKSLDSVSIIGINSIDKYSKLKNPFASNGKISDKEIKGLEKIFMVAKLNGNPKIVLCHHHFTKEAYLPIENDVSVWRKVENQTMKLRKRKKIIKIFEKAGVNAVLHGHVHMIESYTKRGISFNNAGGSLTDSEQGQLRYCSVEITESRLEFNTIIVA